MKEILLRYIIIGIFPFLFILSCSNENHSITYPQFEGNFEWNFKLNFEGNFVGNFEGNFEKLYRGKSVGYSKGDIKGLGSILWAM